MCMSPCPCPLPPQGNATRKIPSSSHDQILDSRRPRTLQSQRHDHLGYTPLRDLATLLPLPDHSPQTREDRCWPPHLLHLAPSILSRQCAREIRTFLSRVFPRDYLHVHPVQLCSLDYAAMSFLVLVSLGECRLHDVGLQLGELERG